MRKIFEQTMLGNLKLKNRMLRSATWEALADNDFYFGGMVRLSNDELITQHKRLTDTVHKYDCPMIVQLAMGEYNRANHRDMEIDAMTKDDIDTVITMFVNAADRAVEAGYDGVQIHAAHGFFLSRFIQHVLQNTETRVCVQTMSRSIVFH